MSDFSCEVYRSFEELAPVAGEWDEFVERAGGDIFGTYDWLRTWWEFYGEGRQLEVALVRRGGRLAGILPFFRETKWLGVLPLRVVRLVGCDHSVTSANVVIEEGFETEVAEAWAAKRQEDWDAIVLSPLPGYAKRTQETAKAFEAALTPAAVRYQANYGPHTVFELAGTFEEFLEKLPKNEKANYRRDLRLLKERHEVRTLLRTGPEEAAEAFERFVPLHQGVWEGKGRLGHFGDWPNGLEYHRKLVERMSGKGRAAIVELTADGKVVACEYCFRLGKFLVDFLTARDESEEYKRHGTGRISLLEFVRYAIGEGWTRIDSLRGRYEYKVRLGGTMLSLKRITVVRRTARARLAMAAFSAAAWVLHTAYYKIWFARAARRLGVARPLWKVWIRSRF